MTDKSDQVSPEPKQAGTQLTDVERLQKELDKARNEAARHRTEKNEYKTKVDELSPLAQRAKEIELEQMTELEKVNTQLADMKAQIATAQADVRAAKVGKLAAQAGVPDDILSLIDTNKINLDEPDAAIATLSKLVTGSKPPATPPANPSKSNGAVTTEQFQKMSGDERVEFLSSNPTWTPS